MALSTYSELQSSIADWLNRTDLTTQIKDFIALSEAEVNSKLRVRAMLSSSAFTIDAETKPLPTGFLQVRDFFITEGGSKFALRYITPSQMDEIKGSSTSGRPVAYTILGDNFRFAPIPSSSYSGTINFYKTFDALSDSNTTNFILTNHPSIYLYGSLYHAANFLGGIDGQRLQQWQSIYTTALERLERNDREDQFSGSPLSIRSDVTVAAPFNDTIKVTTNNT